MKTTASLLSATLAAALITGCYYHDRPRTADRQLGPTMTAPGAAGETIISGLPRGYTTTTYRGTRYYRHGSTWYRDYPGGGYVVVAAPR